MAVTLAKQGNIAGATKEFQEAVRIEPKLAEAHAGLARTLVMQGKNDEAVVHYQKALRLLKAQRAAAAR
jgi:Tfp pilus assembly protein PilF